jgi:hypothetical protein
MQQLEIRHNQPIGYQQTEPYQTDFVDFGAKSGDSFQLGYMLGGKNGLGINTKTSVISIAQTTGVNIIQGDVTNLELPDKCVKYSTLSHFLENLPDYESVEKVIGTALRISTDAIYMAGPVYDDEDYLRSLGFKPYWADWDRHTCHLTCLQLTDILKRNGIKENQYIIVMHAGYKTSASPLIHPINSPANQHNYSIYEHPPKRHMKFDRTCYFEWRCIVSLNGKNWKNHSLLNDLIKPYCHFKSDIGIIDKLRNFLKF